MHLFILAVFSTVLLVGGAVGYLAQMFADTRASMRATFVSTSCFAIGVVGDVIAFCWGLKLLWEAIRG